MSKLGSLYIQLGEPEGELADIESQRRIDYEDWQAESLRQKQEDK